MNMTRPCPVPGCANEAKPGKLLCLACWRLVPVRVQSSVYATWRALRNAEPDNVRIRRHAYETACGSAILCAKHERGIAAPGGAPGAAP